MKMFEFDLGENIGKVAIPSEYVYLAYYAYTNKTKIALTTSEEYWDISEPKFDVLLERLKNARNEI